ncbi:hypothetical protein FPQ18DRAFT_385328 [Pyronema domesticum]|nr:hypothetical protein FPQ18DRAFT_385328 [Pyronema domesticum]
MVTTTKITAERIRRSETVPKTTLDLPGPTSLFRRVDHWQFTMCAIKCLNARFVSRGDNGNGDNGNGDNGNGDSNDEGDWNGYDGMRLIPGKENWNAMRWAEVFYETVYPSLGMTGTIITDRGSVFTSQFWQTMFKLMKMDGLENTAI